MYLRYGILLGTLLLLVPQAHAADSYATHLCATQPERYHCLDARSLARELNTTTTSWSTLLPDKSDRVFVQQLNRTVVLQDSTVLAIPHDRSFDLASHSPFASHDSAIQEPTVIFDPKQLAWAFYDGNGILQRWGTGIGGANWCSDVGRSCRTVTGDHRISALYGKYHRSNRYPRGCGKKKPCARIPYMMTFHPSGYGFHASSDLPGQHASHGCVRLRYDDAAWLRAQVRIGMRVIVRPY